MKDKNRIVNEIPAYPGDIQVGVVSKKKGKKLAIIIGIVAVVIVAAAAVGLFVIKPMFDNFMSAEVNDFVKAYRDADGTAYFPLMDGNVVEIDDNVSEAYLLLNRNQIVVLTKDDRLYYTHTDLKTETRISEDCDSIFEMLNEGIIYRDNDGEYHRYLFSDDSDINIGKISDINTSGSYLNTHYMGNVYGSNLNILYSDNSSVYILASDSKKIEKVANIKNDCSILYISDDGKTAFWDDYVSSEHTIYVYYNGEKTKVGTFDSQSAYATYVSYNKNKEYAVVFNYYSDTAFIVSKDGESMKLKLGGELDSSGFYTKSGIIKDDTASAFQGVYYCVNSYSNTKNLYFIDENGERESVIENIVDYRIYNGYLYYVDENSNLRSAKLSGAKLSDREKITGDVYRIKEDFINGYLFFLKNYDYEDYTGTLYAYKAGSEPIRVASDVAYSHVYSSIDGKTICFFKDVYDIKYNYSAGKLYKYTYGDAKPTLIASDVILGSLSSGYRSELLNNRAIVYRLLSSVKDDYVYGDLYFYNGVESTKMVDAVR